VVRFRSFLSLTFPPSAIYHISRSENLAAPVQMEVAFLGLAGIQGVLPRHYTELLLERVRQKDFALRDFLDIFNHRMISLFYRAWEKYRFPVGYERARLAPQNGYEPFSSSVFHLIGMGTGGLRGRLRSGDEQLLYYSGLIGQQPRSASALQSLLSDYFGVPVAVRQFVGAWLSIDNENRTRLGSGEINNSELGITALLGSKCWDQQAGFRLVLGPLRYEEFRNLLPSEEGFASLVELTRLFTGLTLDFDARLILKAAEVPSCRLATAKSGTLRLGWSSWLKTKEFTHDAADTILGRHLTRSMKQPATA
jgi:type VI secretion system protein ImpH